MEQVKRSKISKLLWGDTLARNLPIEAPPSANQVLIVSP
jgi:hypothetical protein